jgi:hypothetical protein
MHVGSTASAARIEFGTFGGWDTYRLDFMNPANPAVNQLCAVRGYYDNEYKIIFAFYNDRSIKFFVERPDWSLPAGFSKLVRVQIRDHYNNTIYDKHVLLSNDTPAAVKQFRFDAELEFVGAVLAGHNIHIHSKSDIINFNIGDHYLNKAIDNVSNNCFPTMAWIGKSYSSEGLKVKPRQQTINPFY